MAHPLESLAAEYRATRGSEGSAWELLRDVYRSYIAKRERSLLDAASAAAAVHALFLSDRIDMGQVTPQMAEAFRLAYPNVDLSSLAGRSAAEVEGFLSAWKGKYFEVLVRDSLNRGDWVGDIHLAAGQKAVLAESATQGGWDLQILDADGAVARDLQLKATESLSYVKEALERYPDIDVLATDDVLDAGDHALEGVFAGGFSDSALEESVHAPMEALLDSPLEEIAESILPFLPFVLIATGEGRKVLMGRKTFDLALQDGLFRAAKTGAAIGVGALVVLLHGGLVSLPASFLTRIGFDRSRTLAGCDTFLDKKMESIQALVSNQMAGDVTRGT